MRIRSVVFLSISLLVLHVSHAWAQQTMHGNKTEDGPPCWLPEDLRLTSEQMEQMKSIQHRYLEEMKALRTDLLNRRYGLRRLLSDPTAESSEIKEKQKEVFVLENQVQERILDYQLRVREILTAQQFTLWISRNRMPFGHGMRHRRGMGMMHQ